MLGAIAGDIIGSDYEGVQVASADFPLFTTDSVFTDDTVMTVAIAWGILNDQPWDVALRHWGRKYPDAGYGAFFRKWLGDDSMGPYNSWGNGGAMRVSPVGWAYDDVGEVLERAEETSEVSHSHPDGILGAQAVALAVFLARTGESMDSIRAQVEYHCNYDLQRTLAEIRPGYRPDVSAAGSVPQAILCFLESAGVESAIRNAVLLGGDTDTQGCMAGAIAEAYYGSIPNDIEREIRDRLPDDLAEVANQFIETFM